ncbi:response regulator [Pseudomonas oryzihabitans]|uniref:response regulator n=1 Tax=Pseudomonas oryzihabitans TaxID=47885 RepID=UPI00241EB48F|nr:response regulator [Pseudomonas oryzihabitans]
MNTSQPLVLLVEDEHLVRELLCELVLELGNNVVALDRADKALDYLERHAAEVALVITDILMPGKLNGHQLATLITQRWPALPVLITSGFSDQQFHQLPVGTSFIGKPWTYQQMEVAVRRYLPATPQG